MGRILGRCQTTIDLGGISYAASNTLTGDEVKGYIKYVLSKDPKNFYSLNTCN